MTTDVNAPAGSEGQTTVPGQTVPAKPGEKTDPALLLESLKDEREKRRIAEEAKAKAEADLKALQDALASGDQFSEEGKILQTQIQTLEGTIASMTRSNELKDLHVKFPALKDKATEFQTYVDNPTNAGMSLETAAKSFLIDNNLLVTPQARKGLEQPSGGGRTVTPQGMTHSQAEELRKNNFRQYSKLVREGKLNDLIEG